jgi:hypothetical protein
VLTSAAVTASTTTANAISTATALPECETRERSAVRALRRAFRFAGGDSDCGE